jgi:glycosyltransferase involved in cell wall biosynthesis
VSGRPIVAAQTQAIAEILTDHHNCLLVDYKKPEAWSQALQLLSDDTELRERLINQAQLDGAEYTWDKRAQALNTFITKHLPA